MIQREPADRLIVALDTENSVLAWQHAQSLQGNARFYKIGTGLLADDGIDLAARLKAQGHKLFLDLKLYDIASTVQRAVRNLTRYPAPDLLTVHGDPQIIAAAVQGRAGSSTRILAVTILTDLERDDLDKMLISQGDLQEIVSQRAIYALEAGADGLVTSANEVSMLRELPQCKGKILVTPGIRPTGYRVDDQKRTATPTQAIQWGADYLVIGRPILTAINPAQATERIIEEIQQASNMGDSGTLE